MGLFDIFSSNQGTRAARNAYTAQNQGLSAARGDITGNNQSALDLLNTGTERGINYLQEGANKAGDFLNQSLPAWQALFGHGNAGLNLYDQLTGADGNTDPAARQAFLENTPGYQFSRDQQQQAIERSHAAQGNLRSGNTDTDLMNAINGVASSNYFNILNSLQPYFGLATGGATGLGNIYGALANNASNLASNESDLASGYGRNAAAIKTGQGTQLANIDTSKGQNLADLYQNQYAAKQGASQNLWNAILGIAGAGANVAGSYLGRPTTTYNFGD